MSRRERLGLDNQIGAPDIAEVGQMNIAFAEPTGLRRGT
jgi:hypothetical protein